MITRGVEQLCNNYGHGLTFIDIKHFEKICNKSISIGGINKSSYAKTVLFLPAKTGKKVQVSKEVTQIIALGPNASGCATSFETCILGIY